MFFSLHLWASKTTIEGVRDREREREKEGKEKPTKNRRSAANLFNLGRAIAVYNHTLTNIINTINNAAGTVVLALGNRAAKSAVPMMLKLSSVVTRPQRRW